MQNTTIQKFYTPKEHMHALSTEQTALCHQTPSTFLEKKSTDTNHIAPVLSENGFFSGYASTYHLDSAQDMIRPGAFRHTLSHWKKKGKNPPLLWQHDLSQPIGVFKTIYEDDTGLFVEGQLLLELRQAQEAYVLLKNSSISGLSIGFENVLSHYNPEKKAREIFQVNLVEISIVTRPANHRAEVRNVKKDAMYVNSS